MSWLWCIEKDKHFSVVFCCGFVWFLFFFFFPWSFSCFPLRCYSGMNCPGLSPHCTVDFIELISFTQHACMNFLRDKCGIRKKGPFKIKISFSKKKAVTEPEISKSFVTMSINHLSLQSRMYFELPYSDFHYLSLIQQHLKANLKFFSLSEALFSMKILLSLVNGSRA